MKSDLRVVAACLAVVVCLVVLFFLVDRKDVAVAEAPSVDTADTADVRSGRYYSDFQKPAPRLVNFDPNTADSTVLLGLGLPAWTVRAIYKYRAKGGTFQSPEDFARMNGITSGLYKALRPYIIIGEDFRPAAELVGPRTFDRVENRRDTVAYPEKLTAGERLSVNDADTNALKKVPGIGSYYAAKVVELRARYGGFTDLSQLLDLRGFPEEALQYLTIPDGGVKRINVNKATFRQLASHPYIGYKRAKGITSYRKLKGRIENLSQLRLIEGFSEDQVSRLEPYIEY